MYAGAARALRTAPPRLTSSVRAAVHLGAGSRSPGAGTVACDLRKREHMREIFEAELKQLGADLVTMSRQVELAISNAGTALLTGDVPLAESVIVADSGDRRARAGPGRALRADARAAGAGRDRPARRRLRAADERDARADGRPRAARRGGGPRALPARRPCRRRCPARSPRCTRPRPGSRAAPPRCWRPTASRWPRSIERDDDLLDQLHEDTFTALLGGNWNGTPQETVDVTLLGRYYERFGDHAVSIARRVTFLVTGDFQEDLRVR